ncbi:MAG: T9SS type A sorting domain-containing protein [Ignavibacteria bacterium]|jgi:chitinase|nr:T9SS type A sorting domain-containing protein [Ignavibacteria bacterium]
MKKYILLFALLCGNIALAQSPALVGYWQNWQDSQSPYIHLTQIDTTYNVIEVSFAIPAGGTTYNMTFTPDAVSQATLISQIDSMKAKGKKVVISIGGATAQVILNDASQMNTFVSSMTSIINTYHFDGIDIDLENSTTITAGTTIANPTDVKIINLINGIKQLMTNFRNTYHKKMYLTMAPETAYVQGGMSAFGGIWGAYLPIIHALRDSIDILHVQLYNSGSMFGIDGREYFQGTADFIVAMTEAVIHGFNTAGGQFAGLRADQVAVGLPACTGAAGAGSFIHPDTVRAAIKYLMGTGPKPGTYTRVNSYPTLRGMMTWSINWDNTTTCHTTRYEFAKNFVRIFAPGSIGVEENTEAVKDFRLNQNYPNPFNPSTVISFEVNKAGNISIVLFNNLGKEIQTLANAFYTAGSYQINFSAENLTAGTYYYKLISGDFTETKKMVLVK